MSGVAVKSPAMVVEDLVARVKYPPGLGGNDYFLYKTHTVMYETCCANNDTGCRIVSGTKCMLKSTANSGNSGQRLCCCSMVLR